MRKWLALLIVLLLTVLPLAATETKTVTADVMTSVSGYLLHGFLEKTDKTLRDTALVTDALGKDGSDLYYTIRTNQTASMIKTLRRKSYGFRDTEYFFLKIMFESYKPRSGYVSHKILS